MCGIVAITGTDTVAGRLVDGLKRLEYRGYDSAGIAVMAGETIERRRASGKIVNLEALMADMPVDGPTGIAHTRWATHGKPNETNAHPHMSGKVAIVHNGIIENFRELREDMQAQGRTFESETDSEVIAQMIDQNMADGMEAVDAFEAALRKLSGAFAIAAIFSDKTDLKLVRKTASV